MTCPNTQNEMTRSARGVHLSAPNAIYLYHYMRTRCAWNYSGSKPT